MTPWAGSTFGFQPTIVPSSVAKRKKAGPELPFFEITKSDELGSKVLNACPVGAPTAPVPADGGAGIATTRGWGLPAPSYSVATPAWLSDTQIGLPGPTDVPQGFFRFASVCAASPGISETRFVWAYDRVAIALRPAEAGVTIPEETVAADTAATAASATTKLRTLMVLPFFSRNESADRSRGHPPVRPREIVERLVVASPS